MRRILILLTALALLLTLTCAVFAEETLPDPVSTEEPATEEPTEPPTAPPTQPAPTQPAPTQPAPTQPAPTEPPTQPPTQPPTEPPATQAPTQPVNAKATATALIGRPVSELYAAIGYPTGGSSYAYGCNGPGEDGELYYDGFTVYTYRYEGVETIVDVW